MCTQPPCLLYNQNSGTRVVYEDLGSTTPKGTIEATACRALQVSMVTISEFIDSIPHLSASTKATLQKHVQSQEFGASLDADCDEVFQEVLQENLPATLNLLDRATLKEP